MVMTMLMNEGMKMIEDMEGTKKNKTKNNLLSLLLTGYI